MTKIMLFTFLVTICPFSFGQDKGGAFPTVIYLAATDWCPYSCDNKSNSKKGIVYEYLTYLFKEHDIELHIKFFPWSRAIKEVAKGRMDGLLTAVPAEAPRLLFTRSPTMNYSVCFFTETASDWQYKEIKDLQGVTLAVIQDYAYGEPIDSYIQSSDEGVFVIKSGGIARQQRMLVAQRFDTFIADSWWHGS